MQYRNISETWAWAHHRPLAPLDGNALRDLVPGKQAALGVDQVGRQVDVYGEQRAPAGRRRPGHAFRYRVQELAPCVLVRYDAPRQKHQRHLPPTHHPLLYHLWKLPGKFNARLCSRVASSAQWTVNKLLVMGASGRPCNKQAALCSMFVEAPYLQAIPFLREVWRDADSATCCSRKAPSTLSRQTKRVSLSSACMEVAQLASIAPDTDMHTDSCRTRAAQHPYATFAQLKHKKQLMRGQCCSLGEP